MNKLPRFLLLDDDPMSLTLTAKVIENTLHRPGIITFPSARETLSFLGKDDLLNTDLDTVLLTDLHMPEMDGFALLDIVENQFRDQREKLHIFAISAEATADEVRKIFSYRCVTGFYVKPITVDNIKEIINCIKYRL